MADTNIGWTDKVWNPTVGCSRVSAGCENCYAETFASRLEGMGQARYRGLTVIGKQGARWTSEVRQVPEVLTAPLGWRKGRRIFVNSMSDLFHEAVPFEYVAAVFGVMAACPQHTFQVLTKRPQRAVEFFSDWLPQEQSDRRETPAEVCRSCALDAIPGSRPGEGPWSDEVQPLLGYDMRWPLPNVHLGVTVEDQQRANERLPILMRCPAAVRWVSFEPLLGPVDVLSVDEDGQHGPGWHLTHVENRTDYGTGAEHDVDAQVGIDWAVVGGETGEGRRERSVAELEDLVAQLVGAGVPTFVKQDAGKYPGRQGRISDATWGHKEFPASVAKLEGGP